MMGFFPGGFTFFPWIITLVIAAIAIGQFFDYRKAKLRIDTERVSRHELEEIRRELASVKEMVADVLLELDRLTRLPSAEELKENALRPPEESSSRQ